MPLRRLVPGADEVLTQETDFSRDVLARYVCNTFLEAQASTDPNPRPDVGRNNARPDARPFDIIIVGGGTFGSALAEHLFFRGFGRSHRILVLEAGSFVLPEHVQNLPALGLGVADATSIQDLRNAGQFGPDKPQKEVWGLPWHSPQKFPGLAYCVGGRSLYWGGWSPELLAAELPAAWPAKVVSDLQAAALPDGSHGYFWQASDQIGVTQTNDFIFGDLHRALREQLRDGIATVTGAIALGSLPDHPAVRFRNSPPTDAELLALLGHAPTSSPPPTQQLKDELKIEAPLAVQGRPGHAGFFPFNKFSAVPLMMKAAREADSESKTDDVKKRLMLVPRCRVNALKTSPVSGTLRVTEVMTERGTITVPANGVVVIALATIESTRLALHSFQDMPAAAYGRIGKNLIAHLRSNLDIRVPRAALASLPATVKALQASALFVKGRHNYSAAVGGGVGHFHLQITATGGGGGLTNSEAELFKKVPDIDKFEQHLNASDTHFVITMRGIGEMEPLNPQSFVRPDPETEFGVARAFVSIQPSAKDKELWDAMDRAADDVARIFANGHMVDLIVRGNVKKIGVDATKLADELPYLVDNPNAPGTKMNNPERRDGLGTTHHESGTLWMGDANQSVTDANGRFHEVRNAYVAGPALFPTIGSPNPMLTGIALARRLGDHLLPPPPAATPDAGFTYLFDGTGAQFKNWKMASGGGGSFVIINRALVAQPSGDIGLLYYSAGQFEDFILRLDFLLSRPTGAGNDKSGVFLRFRDPSKPVQRPDGSGISDLYNNQAYVAVNTGFEVQIDEEARGDGRIGEGDGFPFNHTGAIYKIKDFGTADGQQDYKNTQKLGQETWHRYELEVSGNTYIVRLNGVEATRFKRKASDSFRGNPPSLDPDSGFIGLQTHTGQLSFANVRVKAI